MSTIDQRLEAEYNNRAKVPDHPDVMAGWKRDAAAFRDAHPHAELGLRYGASERSVLDVFWPDEGRQAPVAMFIHGGYWAALDRSWFSHLAAGFVANGVALAVPSYDLCPAVTMADIVERLREAAGFLIARRGGDIYALGHSAGGHLTAMLLATDWRGRGVTAGAVFGGCSISGLFDLRPLVATSINIPLRLDEDGAARLSPINLPAPGRLLRAYVGEREGDAFTWQSRAMADAWDGVFQVLPGADHFTAIAPLADARSELIAAVMTDIRHHAGGDAGSTRGPARRPADGL